MILDYLDRAPAYRGLHSDLAAAFDFLAETDFSAAAPGRIDIDGDRIYALVQDYQSRPRAQGVWEAHRRYLDVQYMVSGRERMGWSPVSRLTTTRPYDAAGDCELFEGPGDFVTLSAGMFAVFYPADAHMPAVADGDPSPVRKVVVKVRLDTPRTDG